MPAGTTLAIAISSGDGTRVARVDLDGAAGLRRAAWNLRSVDPAQPAAAAGGGRGGRGGPGGRGGGGGDPVPHGRYVAQLIKISGGTETPIGSAQPFFVRPLPQ
jgi:hypothetical protein